jgi:hypothetical protein
MTTDDSKMREFMLDCIYSANAENWEYNSEYAYAYKGMCEDDSWNGPHDGYLQEEFDRALSILLDWGYVVAGTTHLHFPQDLMEQQIASDDYSDWDRAFIRKYGWDIKVD